MKKLKNIIKKILGRTEPNSPLAWHTISSGPLQGYKLYGDIAASWFNEMIAGIYDNEIFEQTKRLFYKGKIVVEVGAHVGYHTMAFAKEAGAKGRVFAFEPNPHNTERLSKNLEKNKDLHKRIVVLEMALSDKNGTEEFVFGNRVDKGSSSGSFLDRAHTIWDKSVYESEKIGYKRMEVKTRTLDSLRADQTIKDPIALCKIDVEGGEYLVLSGALQTLRTDRPIILIEVHSIFNMWKVKEILDAEKYSLSLLKEESDGRCFFVAHPHHEN